MGNLVGKSKRAKKNKSRVTDQDRAVLDLKNSRDRLQKYQKRLDKESSRLQSQALTLVKEGQKDKALLLLKIKKFKQEQASKADGQLLSVMQMMENIEWGSQQLKVFEALKEGNVALDRLHTEMPLDKVEELMDDTAESIAMSEEISRAIGGSWTDANEEDLLREFDKLQAEMASEQAQELSQKMPAPVETPVAVTEGLSVTAAQAPEPKKKTGGGGVGGGGGKVQEEVAPSPSLASQLPEAPTGPVVVKSEGEAGVEAAVATAIAAEEEVERQSMPLPA